MTLKFSLCGRKLQVDTDFDLKKTLLIEDQRRRGLMGFETVVVQPEVIAPKIRVVGIADFLNIKLPPREDLLSPILPTQGLVMVHAFRGVGKTHVSLGIAVAVASGGKFLRWEAPRPQGVLFLDGEMPAVTIQERLSHSIINAEKEVTAPFYIVTPDLQEHGTMPDLSTLEGQLILEPYLENVSLVIVDNIGTLCRAGRENEAESWLPVQGWALRLRAKGKSVVFIHHDGKGGQQRGTSRKEDVLDTVIHLKRPADYRPEEGARFDVHYEKHRGFYGNDAKPFEAKLTTDANGQFTWTMKDLEDSLTEKVADLLNEGIPQHEIPEMLGVAKGTVSKHKKKAQTLGLLTVPSP
jgi:putative DNA primase/helicase